MDLNFKSKSISLVVFIIILIALGIWYWYNKNSASIVPASVTQEASKGIGGAIFEKTQDPLKTKLPETNPIKRVIKNPFE